MNESTLIELLDPVVAALGLEIDDLKLVRAGKHSVLRISLDGDGSQGRGPDLDQIADATRAISQTLDDSDASGSSPYTLEVSSRGVSSPLVRPAQWRRNISHLVKVSPHDGEAFTGRIVSADETWAELDVDGHAQRVDYDTVHKAVVQIEMNRKSREN